MKRRVAAIAALAIAPLFAACAMQPQVAVAPTPAPTETPLVAPELLPDIATQPTPSESGSDLTPILTPPSAATPAPRTPAPRSASPKPKQSATPKPKPTPTQAAPSSSAPKPSNAATPKPTTAKPEVPAAPVDASGCTGQSLAMNATGDCVKKVQELLAGQKLFTGAANGTLGQSTANAVLNYQRSRGLTSNAIVGPDTWAALTSGRGPAGGMPASCKASGVVLCASQGARTLTLLRDGQAIKTINVRFGGMTKDDNGKLRIFPTVNGRYSVYAKDAKAFSDRWEASMPYSIKFNPNMYVHYSGDFAKRGYAGSSHGCINVGNLNDAKWFFENTPVGAKVIVH